MSFHEGSSWQERMEDAKKNKKSNVKNINGFKSASEQNQNTIEKYIGGFLERNEFKKIETKSWANDLCNVVISDKGFEVANNNGDVMYSENHNIYWLVGHLTWFDYISKNYKK